MVELVAGGGGLAGETMPGRGQGRRRLRPKGACRPERMPLVSGTATIASGSLPGLHPTISASRAGFSAGTSTGRGAGSVMFAIDETVKQRVWRPVFRGRHCDGAIRGARISGDGFDDRSGEGATVPDGAPSDTQQLKQTPLTARHEAHGGRMIPFAGWLMPVQYAGVISEHRAVRQQAGLFDLGHMGQVDVRGPDALPFLQWVTTNDVSTLEPGQAHYSLLPNPGGGVIDDIIIYRRPAGDGYMVVINAANSAKDIDWLQRQRAARSDLDVAVADVSDQLGMVAIQGPNATAIVQRLTPLDLGTLPYFAWRETTVAGIRVMIARTGYTGEDGFEFYPAIGDTPALWDALLAAGADDGLVPIGLGARDTLRLEARMPLYGNELGDDISPLEAGLGWAVKLDKGDFIGRDAMVALKEQGAPRRTVGFKLEQRAGSPRAGYEVQLGGRPVGVVTSGAFSPTLGENIGLALVEREVAGIGKPLQIIIRGKPIPATQIKVPFYKRSQ